MKKEAGVMSEKQAISDKASDNLVTLQAMRAFYSQRPVGAEKYVKALDAAIRAVSYVEGLTCPADGIKYDTTLFGARLANALAESDMTAKELAVAIKMTPATMTGYIHGRREPRVSVLVTLANALHRPIGWFLGLTEEVIW